MIISSNSKWAEFLPFATDERLAYFKDNIKECAPFNFGALTVIDFVDLASNKIPDKLKCLFEGDITIRQRIEAENAVQEFLEWFQREMEACTLEPTMEEEEAARGLPQLDIKQNMLIFVKKHFGKGYEYAQDLTMYEYILAKREAFIDAKFNRNIQKIQMRKKP